MVVALVVVALVVATFASGWVLFEKAGEAGWKALVPILGAVVMLKIIGRPWWWLLWMCVPLIGLIPAWLVCVDTARTYGKGTGFAVGLALLTPIFYLLLAFGDATYVGPRGVAPQRRFAKAA